MAMWEPWTGCHGVSDGCTYCYYYGLHAKRRGTPVTKTEDFDKPLVMKTKSKYKIESGKEVGMCFTTDFFIEEADQWRGDAWRMMKQRSDLNFLFLTKRIDRFRVALPEDWGDGYDNVKIGCSVENQDLADYRLPHFLSSPIKHRFISCSPLLGPIDLRPYLHGIEHVTVGGETGRDARECNFDWVLDIREQCMDAGITFWFKDTGSRFRKDGELHKINPRMQHKAARELGINIEA
ncbi:MAG: DUF5131 family protein [Oscillospiraceae bacterium]